MYGLVGLLIGIVIGVSLAPLVSQQNGKQGMMDEHSNGMMMSGGNVDQHFIEQMIPHHEGAIAMAKVALEKSSRPEIISLASGIISAQEREITNMQDWYAEWYGQVPTGTSNVGNHMMRMEGMEGDLTRLQQASDFDEEFLRQMIVHHEMAVMMAQMLESGTQRPEMKQLASAIISSQTREIEMMRSWSASWFGTVEEPSTMQGRMMSN